MDAYKGFREFLAWHAPGLSRLAYVLTGSHHGAEDLLQSALAKTARRWRTVSRYDNPEAYVRRLMYHEAISLWRRWRVVAEYPVGRVPDTPVPDESAGTVRRVMLERALARLTPRQRAVLVLRFYEDRSLAEAAEMLGCSVGTVKSQTAYALSRLRALAPDLVQLVREELT